MKDSLQADFETARRIRHEARLDLVIPFTTPRLTLTALRAANRLSAGLDAVIRLIRVQTVPYPLDLDRSPIPEAFLWGQLERLPSTLPTRCEVRLARDSEEGLRGALREHSVVIVATKKRPWRTGTERLAAHLRRKGHAVLVVREEANHA